MTNEKLYEVLGNINEKYVSEARVYQKAKKPIWAKWGAIAACLVLVCVVATPLFLHNNDSVTTLGIADAAPMIYVNDTLYKQSTSQTSFNELKGDFVYLGVIESDVTNFQGTNDAGNYLDGIPKKTFRQITLLLAQKFINMAKTSSLGLAGNTGCMKTIIAQTLTETQTGMARSPITKLPLKKYQNKTLPQTE